MTDDQATPTAEASNRVPDISPVLERLSAAGPPLTEGLTAFLGTILGASLRADRFSLQDRAAALGRPMAVAHLDWPRQQTRLALGIDPALAHALVDRMLGFERDLAELHLQITPVEWGILGFLATQGLDWLEGQPGTLGPWDLVLDRVGPGPFEKGQLGPIVTFRWRVRVGNTIGSARLWLPWSLLTTWLGGPILGSSPTLVDSPGLPSGPTWWPDCLAEVVTWWRIVAGFTSVPVGPDGLQLRVGKLILIDGSTLEGEPAAPTGPVSLQQDLDPASGATNWRATLDLTPGGASSRLTVLSPPGWPCPDEARAASTASEARRAVDLDRPGDEVALTVVIGSLQLSLAHLASLRPGTILGLGAETLEQAEIWLDGRRCVARGELVRIDAEVGIRITETAGRSIDDRPPRGRPS